MYAESVSCPVGESHCILLDEVRQLRKQVITDPLTGLFNVRHFRNSMEQELERTRRTGEPVTLMMVDLDHFKSINDTWGHESGNVVLKTVADLLQTQTRKLDICCRYGGEEFAVILPATQLMLAKQVAERFRMALEGLDIDLGETSINVTASIGIAVSDGRSGDEVPTLITRADECLYEAKHNGRNCVIGHAQKMPESSVTLDERDALRGLFSDD
ncbi:MAG: GGDEF domain-containing protein [Thalassolituus sp.]